MIKKDKTFFVFLFLFFFLFSFIFSQSILAFSPFWPNPTYKIADLDKPLEEISEQLLEEFDIKEMLQRKVDMYIQEQNNLEDVMEMGNNILATNPLDSKIVYVKSKEEVNSGRELLNIIDDSDSINKSFGLADDAEIKEGRLYKIKADEIDIEDQLDNEDDPTDETKKTLEVQAIQREISKIENLDEILYAHGNYYIDSFRDVFEKQDLVGFYSENTVKENIKTHPQVEDSLFENRKYVYGNNVEIDYDNGKITLDEDEIEVKLDDETKEELKNLEDSDDLNNRLLERKRVENEEVLLATFLNHFTLNYSYYIYNDNEQFEGRNSYLTDDYESLYEFYLETDELINKATRRSAGKGITASAYQQNSFLIENIKNQLLVKLAQAKSDRNTLVYYYLLNKE